MVSSKKDGIRATYVQISFGGKFHFCRGTRGRRGNTITRNSKIIDHLVKMMICQEE